MANVLADPTDQLPAHEFWNSYNLYRYEQGAPGRWIAFVERGRMVNTPPLIGDRPVLMTHGLGGSIRNNRYLPLAQNLIDNALATSIIGFEYDSQDRIETNGRFLRQAIELLNAPTTPISIIAHSMGGLVARSAIQAGPLPVAASGNRLITLGTPHLGSPVAEAIQISEDLALRTALIAALNQGGFVNADLNPSEVSVLAPGFTDLRPDSQFLAALNAQIGDHPQFDYYTIAGTNRGQLGMVNDLLRVQTDDGLVTVESANALDLGALGSGTAPVTHTELTLDEGTVFGLIRAFLRQ